MSWVEIVGYAAMYIVGLIAGGYLLIALMAVLNRRGGLESIPAIIGPAIAFWIVGAAWGLVMLGKAIG